MTSWQTIDTAPRDESDILLFDGTEIFVGCYYGEEKEGGRWIVGEVDVYPTHFMPLPEPPHE